MSTTTTSQVPKILTGLTVAFSLGVVLYLGIMTNSSMAVLSIWLILTVFLCVPVMTSWLGKRKGKLARGLGVGVRVLWLGTFVYFVAITLDHLFMVNGSYYPRWLATSKTISPDQVFELSGRAGICQDHGWGEFYRKSNGVFLRCGVMTAAPKTYFVPNYDQAHAAWEQGL